jgi:hypothetical protein
VKVAKSLEPCDGQQHDGVFDSEQRVARRWDGDEVTCSAVPRVIACVELHPAGKHVCRRLAGILMFGQRAAGGGCDQCLAKSALVSGEDGLRAAARAGLPGRCEVLAGEGVER